MIRSFSLCIFRTDKILFIQKNKLQKAADCLLPVMIWNGAVLKMAM